MLGKSTQPVLCITSCISSDTTVTNLPSSARRHSLFSSRTWTEVIALQREMVLHCDRGPLPNQMCVCARAIYISTMTYI